MQTHRFRIGDKVTVAAGPVGSPIRPGTYTITRLLPYSGRWFQYRARNDLDTYERVLDEPQLVPIRR